MMPREKTAQFSSAPPLNKLNSAARPPPVRWLNDVLNHSCKTHNHHHRQGIQNAPAQFRYLDCVEKRRNHPLNLDYCCRDASFPEMFSSLLATSLSSTSASIFYSHEMTTDKI